MVVLHASSKRKKITESLMEQVAFQPRLCLSLKHYPEEYPEDLCAKALPPAVALIILGTSKQQTP